MIAVTWHLPIRLSEHGFQLDYWSGWNFFKSKYFNHFGEEFLWIRIY